MIIAWITIIEWLFNDCDCNDLKKAKRLIKTNRIAGRISVDTVTQIFAF